MAISAVSPDMTDAAASSKPSPAGFTASRAAETAAYSAKAPFAVRSPVQVGDPRWSSTTDTVSWDAESLAIVFTKLLP